MAEIERDSINKAITFGIAGITPTTAVFSRGSATPIPGVILSNSVKIPYEITKLNGDFDLTWTFTVESIAQTSVETHTVVSPLFSQTQLVAADPSLLSLSAEQVANLERSVRGVIEYICGQSFVYQYDVVAIKGTGSSSIRLPKRLVSATTINSTSNPQLAGSFTIADNGWSLVADSGSSWIDSLNSFYAAPPMTNPYSLSPGFKQGTVLYMEGFWGYRSIPEEIALAALTLAVDYGADESVWRNRYVKTVSFGQETVQFRGDANYGTGNAIVDQLLCNYTLSNLSVI